MKKRSVSIGAVLATFAASPSAEACRVFRSPEQRIAETYTKGTELRVALVRIAEARHLTFPMSQELRRRIPGYEDPWRATASVTRMLAGEQSPELVIFDRGWGSSACDDGTKMPRKGDEWVVYYVPGRHGEAEVLETYPREIAMHADARLRSIVR
jgi:hypothetical protein